MQITHSGAQCPVHVIIPLNFCSPDIVLSLPDALLCLACAQAEYRDVSHLLCLPALLPGRCPSLMSSSCSAHIVIDRKSDK